MALEPRFRLSIPKSLWLKVATEVDRVMADAWIYDAHLENQVLTFRTQSGHDSAMNDPRFREVLKNLEIKAKRPPPWPGDGGRKSVEDAREGK